VGKAYKIAGLLLFLTAFGFFGCSGNRQSADAETIRIEEISEKPEFLADTVLFSSGEVVFLEGKDGAYLQSLSRVQLTSDGIYVLDQSQAKLFLFSRDGKFISKVDALGRGPREYISFRDFYVDEENETVFTYHDNPGRIMCFDLRLNFKEAIELSATEYYMNVVIENDSFIWRVGSVDSKCDITMSPISKPDNMECLLEKKDAGFQGDYFNRVSLLKTRNVNITRYFDYTIYQLQNKKLIPAYRFDFIGNTPPASFGKDMYTYPEKQLEASRERYVFTMGSVHESERYLMFLTNLAGFFVLDKTDRDIQYYRGFANHDGSSQDMDLIPLNNSENKVCFNMLTRGKMSGRSDYQTNPEFKKSFDERNAGNPIWEIYNLSDDEINAVLLFYTFKE
jgi:hypothetical protein